MLAVTLCCHLLSDRNSSSPGDSLPSVPHPAQLCSSHCCSARHTDNMRPASSPVCVCLCAESSMKVTSSPVTAAHGALFNPSIAVMDFRVTTHFLLNLASTQRSLKMGAAVMQLLQGGAGCALGPGAPS
ncbi:hypothetical protein CgunFtcFv8_018736 [Champsocephalus gunnari]|uniref:Uncharacterized protein n=1 Tax=Champsocephalus gunnari TaxID=52237 RepID=A0AAN8BU12_CHAGU|nr:hypothetical protein CgunFtcFv8_018736 [Champsocephalus gunnari]